MIDLRSKNGRGAPAGEAGGRLAKTAGRLVLWGCVVVLLIRGIASVLAGPPPPARAPARPALTITQPAAPAAPAAGRGRRAP
jgi:hypothetical protein